MTDPVAALRAGLRDRYAFERDISRDWLRIDPHYAPIRTHPAFVRLLAGG